MANSVPAANPVTLLQSLIRCASVTPTEAGVLDVLEAALAPLGFAVTRLRFEGDGSYPVDNLFATRGSAGPHLLFAGHTDVVPPGDASLWTPRSVRRRDRRRRALSAAAQSDMKSGIAAFVAALAAVPPTPAGSRSPSPMTRKPTASTARPRSSNGPRRRDTASISPSSASRARPRRSATRSRSAGAGSLNGRITVTGIQGHVAYPHKALQPAAGRCGAVAALVGHARRRHRTFPAVQSRIHLDRRRQRR